MNSSSGCARYCEHSTIAEDHPRVRHFLSSIDLKPSELADVLGRAIELKAMHRAGLGYTPLDEQTLMVLSHGPVDISRTVCELAVVQLGGRLPASSLSPDVLSDASDWVRVLSGVIDGFLAVGVEHRALESVAKLSRTPVINHSNDRFSPCTWLADLQTFQEHRGSIEGKHVAWIGRGSATCRSFIQGTARLGYHLGVSSPAQQGPDEALLLAAGDSVSVHDDSLENIRQADLIVTDDGLVADPSQAAYQLTPSLLENAKSNSLTICHLTSRSALAGEQDSHEKVASHSAEAAENQLHVQKALLELLLAN